MTVSVNLQKSDIKRLDEAKILTEAVTRSEVLRTALREYHKKILSGVLTTSRKPKLEEEAAND